MSAELISLILFFALFLFIALGLPVAFIMAGLGVFTSLILWGWQSTGSIVMITFSKVSDIILVAAPLYVLMGYLLENSGMAERLYEMFYRWTSGIRGGLAISTVFICVLFAAMTGVIAAATVTMGIIALPAMLKRNYDPKIAVGTIAASGTLGILIPPSIMMIILCMVTQQSVGKIFAGGIGCGLLMAVLFSAYIFIRGLIHPNLVPATKEKFTWGQRFSSLIAAIAPMILIIGVLGAIFAGITTPTEASAISALGALICMIIYKRFSWEVLRKSFEKTVFTSAMVVWIIVGAATLVSVYIRVGAIDMVTDFVLGMNVSLYLSIGVMLAIIFVLGMFVEPAGIIMLVGPLFAQIAKGLGIDLIWFGVLFVIMLQIGYLTPPFGISLFFMKAVCPPHIRTIDIYKSIIPFIVIMIATVILILIFPGIATWLPSVLVK